MKFPRLFKKTSTGAIQFWDIGVTEEGGPGAMAPYYGGVRTKYGQMGTDSPQETVDYVYKGKNIGKKNQTTALQQAVAEAQAKWEKQKKKGYVESVEAAEAEQLDNLIEGGVVPMLAQSFDKHSNKIKFPCYAQPKLDGIRCIAILKDGKCTLWSRTRKPITSMPHIVQQLEKGIPTGTDIVLDGELYNHELKANFEKIVSMVRQEEPDPEHKLVQYHIYDIINDESFEKRAVKLRYLKESWFDGSIVKVDTCRVDEESYVMGLFNNWRHQGYEGVMLRNANGFYVNKRSYDLQKVKEFEDAEFEITGIEEGRGRLAGHVGSFVCKTKDGKEFLAKMSGDTGRLREYFLDSSLWKGRLLTVQYQGLTGANGVPRFPVGLRIRENM